MSKFESNSIFLSVIAGFTMLTHLPRSASLAKPKQLLLKSIGWMNGSQSISNYNF